MRAFCERNYEALGEVIGAMSLHLSDILNDPIQYVDIRSGSIVVGNVRSETQSEQALIRRAHMIGSSLHNHLLTFFSPSTEELEAAGHTQAEVNAALPKLQEEILPIHSVWHERKLARPDLTVPMNLERIIFEQDESLEDPHYERACCYNGAFKRDGIIRYMSIYEADGLIFEVGTESVASGGRLTPYNQILSSIPGSSGQLIMGKYRDEQELDKLLSICCEQFKKQQPDASDAALESFEAILRQHSTTEHQLRKIEHQAGEYPSTSILGEFYGLLVD